MRRRKTGGNVTRAKQMRISQAKVTATKRVKLPRGPSKLEVDFHTAWLRFAEGVAFGTTEHKFHPVRDWRFDVAWPSLKVAVELHGGTRSGGRHVRGDGFQGDCHKVNAAVIRGWRVLAYTSDDVRKRPQAVVREVLEVLRLVGTD